MKRFAFLLILSCSAISPVVATASAASVVDPCLQKRADILRQIDQAKQHGNANRVAGLNKALREQETHCTPESIRQAREEDVAEARQKVAERQRELEEAKRDGRDADKIAKREAKLKEAQEDFAQARKVLGK